jgi:hypothetical protein
MGVDIDLTSITGEYVLDQSGKNHSFFLGSSPNDKN